MDYFDHPPTPSCLRSYCMIPCSAKIFLRLIWIYLWISKHGKWKVSNCLVWKRPVSKGKVWVQFLSENSRVTYHSCVRYTWYFVRYIQYWQSGWVSRGWMRHFLGPCSYSKKKDNASASPKMCFVLYFSTCNIKNLSNYNKLVLLFFVSSNMKENVVQTRLFQKRELPNNLFTVQTADG